MCLYYLLGLQLLFVCVSCVSVRKEVRDLTPTELNDYFEAFQIFKAEGRKDGVTLPFATMDEAVAHHGNAVANVTGDQAHMHLSFLVWHAVFLRELELALQSINPNVTLAYWDWTIDAALEDPTKSVLFTDAYFGSSDPTTHVVVDGPFAYWVINTDPSSVGANFSSPEGYLRSPTNHNSEPTLTRYVGGMSGRMGSLPTADDYILCLNQISYGDFLLCVEQGPDPISIHGRPHAWTGGSWEDSSGDMLDVYTSPNDPIFFSHHTMLDRLYAIWRNEVGEDLATEDDPCGNFYGAQDNPQPPGHNLNDLLQPLMYWGGNEPLTISQGCYLLHSSRIDFEYN